LAILLLIIPKTRRCGLAMAISLALCGIFGNLLLKPLIARTRPYDVNTAIELLIPRLTDFSFPSGHTYSSFAGAVVLLCYYRKTGIAALLLAICISFSRLYFYVHYPTDIIVGILMGVGFFSVFGLACQSPSLEAALQIIMGSLKEAVPQVLPRL